MSNFDTVSQIPQSATSASSTQFNPENLQRGREATVPVSGPMIQFNPALAKGFLASLFDFSFDNFITGKIIKFLYAIFIALAALSAVGVIVKAFDMGSYLGNENIGTFIGIVSLIVSPLIFLVFAIYARVVLEIVMVLFKIEEHTRHRS